MPSSNPQPMLPCSACNSDKGFEINDFSAAECNLFDSMPCIACVELEKLGAKIHDTRLLLEQLAERQRALKSERNHYHDPLVKHLPLEIVSRIFTFRFRMESADASCTHQNVIRVPLTLGAVCRTWNAIARSTPQLWTSVSIKLNRRHEVLHAQLTREWLGRSGQLALSIRIYWKSIFRAGIPLRYQGPPDSMLDSIINAVNEHSNRWQDLEISIPMSLLARLHGSSHDKYILKNLSISPVRDQSESEAIFQMKNMRPSPTKVTICRMALKSIHIRWDHVIHVEIQDLCIDESLELLRQAQQMTHCSILCTRPGGDTFPHPTIPIVHHFLRSLEFKSYTPPDRFYDCISLPALQTLTCHGDFTAPYVTLNALITRSSCHLTALSIESIDLPEHDHDLISLLRKSPFIEDLYISGNNHPIPNRLFNQLSLPELPPGAVDDIFLPHLRSLRLAGGREFDWSCIPQIFPEEPIVINHRRPLSLLDFMLCTPDDIIDVDYVDEETVQRLISVINNGVSITIVDVFDQNLLFPVPDLES